MTHLLTTLSILLIATAGYAQGKIYTETELKVQLPFGEANSTEFSKTYTVDRVIDGDTIVVTTPEGKSEEIQLIGINAPNVVFPEGVDRALMDPTTESVDEADDWGVDLDILDKMGQEATEFVKELMAYKGNAVNLESDVGVRDKYDRLLAYAYKLVCLHPCKMRERKGYEYKRFEDGVYIFVNATIIKSGYATPMTIPPNAGALGEARTVSDGAAHRNVKYTDLFKELYEEAREQGRGLWKNEEERIKNGVHKFYYDNGNLMGEEHYKDGKRDGISKLYYDSGNPMGEESYKDGKLIGTSIEYYEDGQFKGSYEYKDGKRNGISKMVDEEGNLIFERYYQDNKVVEEE